MMPVISAFFTVPYRLHFSKTEGSPARWLVERIPTPMRTLPSLLTFQFVGLLISCAKEMLAELFVPNTIPLFRQIVEGDELEIAKRFSRVISWLFSES